MTTKIILSDRAPVEIETASWPTIASAKQWDGEHESQAARMWVIVVREHADGRRLIYGWYDSRWSGERGSAAGYLLASDDESETIRAIRRVAGVLDLPSIGDECIADLPAEVLS